MSRQRVVAESLRIAGPYPGLRPYQRHESLIFFGRERQIDEMKEKLRTVRFLGVVGTSGCGKSSLVRAGLFPALDSGFLVTRDLPWSQPWPDWTASRWFTVDMQPRNHPYRGLAQGLLDSGLLGDGWDADDPENVPDLAAQLQAGPQQLLRLWQQAAGGPTGNLLIVVDQFEELFRFHDTGYAALAQSFVRSLLELAAQPDWPVYVAITMRSDYLGDCSQFSGLPEVLNAGQFLVSRLTSRDIQAAIEGPARIFDVDLDPLLVTRLLNNVGTDADQLPLLQHALKRTWDLATASDSPDGSPSDRRLTVADYDRAEIGGVTQALNLHAEQVFGELDGRDDRAGDRRIARLLFQCLTTRDASNRDVRNPTEIAVVADVAEVPVDRVIRVAEAFRHPDCCFLTPPAPIPLSAETWLDISHESLLRQWNRLRGWVKTEAEAAGELQRLVRDARSWRKGERGVLRDPELGLFTRLRREQIPTTAWATRYVEPDDFTLADRYLEESEQEKDRERKEKEDARKRELNLERQRAADAEAATVRQRTLTQIAAGTAGVAVLGLLFIVILSFWLVAICRKQTEVLVKATITAPPEDIAIAIGYLREYEDDAIAPLEDRFEDPATKPQQWANAALALAAFGRFDAARQTLAVNKEQSASAALAQIRVDRIDAIRRMRAKIHEDSKKYPLGRTTFIHGYPKLHSELKLNLQLVVQELEQTKSDPKAADFRSGMCAALGLIPWNDVDADNQPAVLATVTELYKHARDGGTHSAAAYALKQWKPEDDLPPPGKDVPQEPAVGWNWFVNKNDMTMIRIPHGTFTMGDDNAPYNHEKPQHMVGLTEDFFLCDREVTVDGFKTFVRDAPNHEETPDEEKRIIQGWDNEDEDVSKKEKDCPVQMVNWYQAVAFCNWLSRLHGYKAYYDLAENEPINENGYCYRLPSEAEWEYACRAASQTQYAFGDEEDLLDKYAWYGVNSQERTWPAGAKLPNGWGLFDMHGNVREWCADAFDDYEASRIPIKDPLGAAGSSRVLRGGSWQHNADACRSSSRDVNDPDDRNRNFGLRVCLSSLRLRPSPPQTD